MDIVVATYYKEKIHNYYELVKKSDGDEYFTQIALFFDYMCEDEFLRLALIEMISKNNKTEEVFYNYIVQIVDLINVFLKNFVEYLEENDLFDEFIEDKEMKELLSLAYLLLEKKDKSQLEINYTFQGILFHFPKLKKGLQRYDVVEEISKKVEDEYQQWSAISEEANLLHRGFFEGEISPLNQQWDNAFVKLNTNVEFIKDFHYKFSWNYVNNVRDSLVDLLAAIRYRFSYLKNLSRIYRDCPRISIEMAENRLRYVSMFHDRMPGPSEWENTLEHIVTRLQISITSIWTISNILSRYKHKCEEYGVDRLKRQIELLGASNGEKALQLDLAEYLFDRGLTPIIEKTMAHDRIDILALGPQDSVIEIKFFRDIEDIKDIFQGFAQTIKYTQAHQKTVGYYVIFQDSDKFKIQTEPFIEIEGTLIYVFNIDFTGLGGRSDKRAHLPLPIIEISNYLLTKEANTKKPWVDILFTDLLLVKDIGPKTALELISSKQRVHSFEDLKKIPGIGEKRISNLEQLITF